MNSDQLDFFQLYLDSFPKNQGRFAYIDDYDSRELVLVFHDTPWNVSVRLAIATVLEDLALRRMIDLVGEDGATFPLYINTTHLSTYPNAQVRRDVGLYFLKQLRISPAEYCHSVMDAQFSKSPFILCGLENPELHEQAKDAWLKQDMERFMDLDLQRGALMAKNLLTKCREHGVIKAGIVCCGNLPEIICENLMELEISYTLFEPKVTGKDNRQQYDNNLNGVLSPLEKLLSENLKEEEAPPQDTSDASQLA